MLPLQKGDNSICTVARNAGKVNTLKIVRCSDIVAKRPIRNLRGPERFLRNQTATGQPQSDTLQLTPPACPIDFTGAPAFPDPLHWPSAWCRPYSLLTLWVCNVCPASPPRPERQTSPRAQDLTVHTKPYQSSGAAFSFANEQITPETCSSCCLPAAHRLFTDAEHILKETREISKGALAGWCLLFWLQTTHFPDQNSAGLSLSAKGNGLLIMDF